MDFRQKRLLIVGASGFIGGLLFKHFTELGYHTVGTQSARKHANFCPFDLVSQKIADVLPPEFLAGDDPPLACICAACASVEACGKDPMGSRAINVSGTIRLIDDLAERGFRIIFVSTMRCTTARSPCMTSPFRLSRSMNTVGRRRKSSGT